MTLNIGNRVPSAVSAPAAQPAPAPQVKQQMAPARALAAPAPANARPQPMALPASVAQLQAAPRPGYLEMVEQLEPMIQRQMAEVQAAMAAKNVGPADVSMVYGIDITGKETSVCAACGIEGHDFQPVAYRKENPEIDMLTESLVVFMEMASRLGIAHGVLAYDDTGVLALRQVSAPKSQTERSQLAERFQKFKDRFEAVSIGGRLVNGRVTDTAWLAAESKNWKPSDATRTVAGEPDDNLAVAEVQRMYAASSSRSLLKGAVFAKSQVPTNSVKSAEAIAKSKGILLTGEAVGQLAAQIKPRFFSSTGISPSMHHLRSNLGAGMTRLISKIKDQ